MIGIGLSILTANYRLSYSNKHKQNNRWKTPRNYNRTYAKPSFRLCERSARSNLDLFVDIKNSGLLRFTSPPPIAGPRQRRWQRQQFPYVLYNSKTSLRSIFGPPGIEPGLYEPSPTHLSTFGLPGIEPGLYEPESYVLPVYYSPMFGKVYGRVVCTTGILRPEDV